MFKTFVVRRLSERKHEYCSLEGTRVDHIEAKDAFECSKVVGIEFSNVAQWHPKSSTVLERKMLPGWIQKEYVIPRYYDRQLG